MRELETQPLRHSEAVFLLEEETREKLYRMFAGRVDGIPLIESIPRTELDKALSLDIIESFRVCGLAGLEYGLTAGGLIALREWKYAQSN